MPQMQLLRRYVARRAMALMDQGQAVDLGGGPGDLALKLAQMAPALDVTGVDLSDGMLAQARERARQAGLEKRVSFRKGDVATIPFPDDALDLVVSTLSLHHWSDPGEIEANQRLKAASEPTQAPQARSRQSPGVDDRLKPLRRPLKRVRTPQYRYNCPPVAVLDEIARLLRPGGAFLIFDLRRDVAFPFWMLLWFATHVVVPRSIRRINEPLGSRDAAFTPAEAAQLAASSRLPNWRVVPSPLWLTIVSASPAVSQAGKGPG
jgi:ubiquinone/menaquinone biosynthesis C-methylase UbiE